MDEENQNDGLIKKAGNALKDGAKKQAKKSMQKVIKKIIMTIVPIILKILLPIIICMILLTAITTFIEEALSDSSKDANAFAVKYSGGGYTAESPNPETGSGNAGGSTTENEKGANSIIVDISKTTENGAYELIYEFKDSDGNIYTDVQAIQNIKNDLLEKNEEIDLTKFSDSELKIIGALMYNGLQVKSYTEEELKALVIFLKADIASQSFDLRSGENTPIDIKDLRTNDEVYGTLELHKTTVETDANGKTSYKEIKLDYVPYGDETTSGTFCYMVAQKDRNVLNKFSIDLEGNLIIARWGESTTTYTYLDVNGKTLSEADKQKISQENILEDVNNLNISLYSLPVNYKQYIAKYITNYGFLSDLLITTENVEFCEKIAELAFNNRIVFNVKEELTTIDTTLTTNCTQSTYLYDYVKYEVSGQKEITTEGWVTLRDEKGNPEEVSELTSLYGWEYGMPHTQTNEYGNKLIYEWTHLNNQKYKLEYIDIPNYKHWTLKNWSTKTVYENLPREPQGAYENEAGQLINLYNNHIKEEYPNYTIDEDYTRSEEFKYILVEETHNESNQYDLEVSEIDCWFLKYDKQYNPPTLETTRDKKGSNGQAQFPQEFDIVVDNTRDTTIINNDSDVQEFISKRKAEYQTTYPEAKNIECKVNNLTIKQKVKTDTTVEYLKTDDNEEYSTIIKNYSFGEDVADATEVNFKNIEYINGQPSYTAVDENGNEEIGFISIYKKYRQDGVDLYLENDAEKSFFSLLEANSQTIGISDTMKYLLYICDGIDRGVTNLNETFRVIDINMITGGGISPFGTSLTREVFIAKAQAYCGEDSLFADLADEFYDICTLPQYNVNPSLAFAWAGEESSFGNNAPYNNLFGMGISNGAGSGARYDSYAESIEDFCKWVINVETPGTSAYNDANNTSQNFTNVNDKFQGTPENNIYVLFSNYAYLGDTHIVDEINNYQSEEDRYNYYKENGSTWGAGGRIQIYYMYEHFLYDGEYSTRCAHKFGTDPTTLQEKADYAQYTVEKRVELAKDIFGAGVFLSGEGYFQESSDELIAGIYTSSSGRRYIEWTQGASYFQTLEAFDGTMANAGCGIFGSATLISSIGLDIGIDEVYNYSAASGSWGDYLGLMKKVLKGRNIDAKVNTGVYDENNKNLFISKLYEGKGILVYVANGFDQLYTKKYHWVVLADIRETQLGSYKGYDVYVLTSGLRNKGHGWQKIETIVDNLQGKYYFYIDD